MTNHATKVMLQLYQEHINRQQLQDVLTSKKSIKRFAWILHDKDEGIKPHYHVLLDFGRSFEVARIPDWFPDHPGLDNPKMIEAVKSWAGSVQYLTHKNDPGKHPYPLTDIVANYDLTDDYEASKQDITPAWFGQLDQVDYHSHLVWIDQNVANVNLANKLFDTIKKRYSLYLIAQEEAGREVKVIFVYGDPGIGKTTFAKWYAKEGLGKSYYVTGSSNDPLEGYNGQGVLIFDDLRDHTFSLTDLLKILDNHTGSLMKARYNNKLFSGSHIIVTSTVPLWLWYPGVDKQENLQQLYRRINDYVILEPGQGTYYRKVDHKTGRPVNDFTTEVSPFDPAKLYKRINQAVKDDLEVQTINNKLKELMHE